MFTGIVTAIGKITKVEQRGDMRLTIAAPLDPAKIEIGASIACSGVCLTVVERGGTAATGHPLPVNHPERLACLGVGKELLKRVDVFIMHGRCMPIEQPRIGKDEGTSVQAAQNGVTM